jgi:tetratricopeptide (TPR) repeat protein
MIDKTPLECYPCVRMRAKIVALRADWPAADRWFAEALRLGPEFPYTESDWGEALMAKGDLSGAITKFDSAHKKGPRYADPLELWGEVLLLRGDAKGAIAKFEEANRYAPHWGHLHLKWGDALTALGKPRRTGNRAPSNAELWPGVSLCGRHRTSSAY